MSNFIAIKQKQLFPVMMQLVLSYPQSQSV